MCSTTEKLALWSTAPDITYPQKPLHGGILAPMISQALRRAKPHIALNCRYRKLQCTPAMARCCNFGSQGRQALRPQTQSSAGHDAADPGKHLSNQLSYAPKRLEEELHTVLQRSRSMTTIDNASSQADNRRGAAAPCERALASSTIVKLCSLSMVRHCLGSLWHDAPTRVLPGWNLPFYRTNSNHSAGPYFNSRPYILGMHSTTLVLSAQAHCIAGAARCNLAVALKSVLLPLPHLIQL